MTSIVKKVSDKKLATPPTWLPDNTVYEVISGSVAYGCSTDMSDMDIVGFAMPPKHVLFPHTVGIIKGFGSQGESFDEYQQHHIKDEDENKVYDLKIYSIVRFFELCRQNNPNSLDSLFTPRECVLTSTPISEIVREARHKFLSKMCWPAFKGYAFSQLSKLGKEKYEPTSKRYPMIQKYGFDVKNACHVYRLLLEVEQILMEEDLDLRRHSEQLKMVRNGEVSREEVTIWFKNKELELEKIYNSSKLRVKPDEKELKQVLINCLEHHYGSIDKIVVQPDKYQNALINIRKICNEIF